LHSARRLARSAPTSVTHNAVALIQKLPQNLLQLRRRVCALQGPLVRQHLPGFERPQARFEGSVIAVIQQIAGNQVKFQRHDLIIAKKKRIRATA